MRSRVGDGRPMPARIRTPTRTARSSRPPSRLTSAAPTAPIIFIFKASHPQIRAGAGSVNIRAKNILLAAVVAGGSIGFVHAQQAATPKAKAAPRTAQGAPAAPAPAAAPAAAE